jgi:hypothetical protein
MTITTQFTQSDLSQFSGCMQPFKNPLVCNMEYTDGVKFVSDNGCGWLVLDMLIILGKNNACLKEEMVVVKVNVSAQTVTYNGNDYETGEDVALFTQQYEGIFDCPFDLTFYACLAREDGTKMLMLPSEY